MALPARILDQIPASLLRGGRLSLGTSGAEAAQALAGQALAAQILATGIPSFDASLPDGGFPRGGIVELAVSGQSALSTSLALATCRSAQVAGRLRGGDAPWCAFIDPSASLYAPGVVAAGVELDRLLVVQPPREALDRVALRIVEAQAFAVVVIDLLGSPGSRSSPGVLGHWPRLIRRFALALEGTDCCLLLVTDGEARRSLPLPVNLRVELSRPNSRGLWSRISKERRGRLTAPSWVEWRNGGPAGALFSLESTQRLRSSS